MSLYRASWPKWTNLRREMGDRFNLLINPDIPSTYRLWRGCIYGHLLRRNCATWEYRADFLT